MGRSYAQLKAGLAVEFSLCVERASGKISAMDLAPAKQRAPPAAVVAVAAAAAGVGTAVPALTTDLAAAVSLPDGRSRGIVERELPKGLVVRV